MSLQNLLYIVAIVGLELAVYYIGFHNGVKHHKDRTELENNIKNYMNKKK